MKNESLVIMLLIVITALGQVVFRAETRGIILESIESSCSYNNE